MGVLAMRESTFRGAWVAVHLAIEAAIASDEALDHYDILEKACNYGAWIADPKAVERVLFAIDLHALHSARVEFTKAGVR